MQVSSGSHNVVPGVFPGGFLSTVGSVGGSSRSRMSHRTFRRQDDHAACLPSPCLGSRARRDPVLQRHHGTAGTGPAHPASRSRRCGARSGGRLRLPSLRDSYAPARPQRPASAAHRGVDHADLDRQHGPGHHLARQLREPASTARSRPLPTCSSSAAPSTSGATTLATRSTRPATRTASRGPSSRASPTTPRVGCGCAPSTPVTSRWCTSTTSPRHGQGRSVRAWKPRPMPWSSCVGWTVCGSSTLRPSPAFPDPPSPPPSA